MRYQLQALREQGRRNAKMRELPRVIFADAV